MAITPSPSDRTLTQILKSSHKIENNTASTASDIKSLAKSMQSFTDSMVAGDTGKSGGKSNTTNTAANPTGQSSPDLSSFASFLTGTNLRELKSMTVEESTNISTFISSITGAISNLTPEFFDSLNSMGKVKPKGVIALKSFIKKMSGIFETGMNDPAKVKAGAEAVSSMATALVDISKNILKSTILLIPAIPLLVPAGIAIKGLALIFGNVGKKDKEIKAGADAFKDVGKTLLWMSAGVVAIGVAVGGMMMIDPLLPLIVPATLLALGGTFALIGAVGRTVQKGADAMSGIGKSMVFMAAGIIAIGAAVALLWMVSPLLLLAVPVMILGIAAAFGLAGRLPLKSGAISMGFVALSMIAISAGMAMIGLVVKEVGAVEILKGLGLIAVTGLVFGLAGTGPIPLAIAAGALALGLAGFSLMALGTGLGMYMDAVGDITLESSAIMIASLVGMGVAFAGIGAAALFIIPGAAAGIAMGVAMLSVAAGVEAVKKADYFKDFDTDKFAEVITGIGGAFAAVGQEGGKGGGGLLGWLTGIELGPNNVKRGIDSVLKAKDAMTSVAEGLVNFKNITAGLNFGKPGEEGGLLTTITHVLGSVGSVFASIGSKDKTDNKSLIGIIFGADFEEGDVENGIEVVQKSGSALKSIAGGLKNFNDFVTNELGGFGSGADGKMDSLTKSIVAVIGTTGTAFAQLGKKGDRGWFDWSDNDAEEGISLANKMGATLESLATGLGAFANAGSIPTITGYTTGPNGEQIPIYGKPTSIDAIGANLKKFIGTSADVLIEMSGKMDKANGSFHVSKVWHQFTEDLLALSDAADPFDKFANAFVTMAGGMQTFSRSFNDMGSPQAMIAFTNWTETLLKLSEAGGEDSMLDGVKAFFGINTAGAEGGINAGAAMDDTMSTSSEREEIYNASIEASGDKAAAAQTIAILNGFRDLSNNILGLKNALLSQGIDVNIIGADGNVIINTKELP